jgi:hypothetical protein
MLKFLQFKDKKERWQPYTLEQLAKPGSLKGKPAFQTVLSVDQDPDALADKDIEPLDVVKYMGPMYLDFDDANDLDHVLDDVRLVLGYLLNTLSIPPEFIHCWLSGGKGVHITIPAGIFGVKGPTKFLPLIYREIMLTIEQGAGLKKPSSTLDHNVYSCGRGRMWRTEGIPRPGKGTFKVGTSIAELEDMNSDEYEVLVASARSDLMEREPDEGMEFMRPHDLFKKARTTASRKVKAMLEGSNNAEQVEALKAFPGIPGCIEMLINEGDQQQSNWNQAAMQLAAYIAARYDKEDDRDEYMSLLVDPFCENVESSGRPEVADRKAHLKFQLQRAFGGQTKFSVGAIIATLGKRCNACPICRSDIAKGEVEATDAAAGGFDPETKIRADDRGYHLVSDQGSRHLCTWTFEPRVAIYNLVPYTGADGNMLFRRSERKAMLGDVINDGERTEVTIDESAWASKRELISMVAGSNAATYCSDVEVQKIMRAVIHFARAKTGEKDLMPMTRSNVCGVILERREDGSIVPHYVEEGQSIKGNGLRSEYRYERPAQMPGASPSLITSKGPFQNDVELERCLEALTKVNEPVKVASILGWFVASHFREHIQFFQPQFPLLNINGNAESGKTSLAMLFGCLNGIDYSKSDFLNAEVGREYALIKFLSNSTTVPRLVEEVNPVTMGSRYFGVVSILKASWNCAAVPRGQVQNKQLGMSDDRISAPIIYTSEQSSTVPSLRGRTVEVTLTAKALRNPVHQEAYKTAIESRGALMRMAKALVTTAMGVPPRKIKEIFESKSALINPEMSSRQRWGHQTCLTGLHMLKVAMKEFDIKGVEHIDGLESELIEYLGGTQVMENERGRSASEVDKVLSTFNQMADMMTEERCRLERGIHYWRTGNSLFIPVQSCMTRYVSFCRFLGETAVIRVHDQMSSLLDGEVYCERQEDHPTRPGVKVFVLNMEVLGQKGVDLNNFVECEVQEPE